MVLVDHFIKNHDTLDCLCAFFLFPSFGLPTKLFVSPLFFFTMTKSLFLFLSFGCWDLSPFFTSLHVMDGIHGEMGVEVSHLSSLISMFAAFFNYFVYLINLFYYVVFIFFNYAAELFLWVNRMSVAYIATMLNSGCLLVFNSICTYVRIHAS